MDDLDSDYCTVTRSIAARCADPLLKEEMARRLDDASRQPDQSARYGAECARLLLERGLLAEAGEIFDALRQQFPGHPSGYTGVARIAMARRDWKKALEYWNEVKARFGKTANYSWELARVHVLMALGRLEDAEVVCHRLTADFASEPGGLVNLAHIAMRAHHWSEARARWNELLKRFGNQAPPRWHFARAESLMELDCLDESEQVFGALADELATQPIGFIGLARVAARRGDWPTALARWDEVMQRFAGDVEPTWEILRANVLVELGHTDEAEAVSRRLIGDEPESEPAFSLLLRVLLVANKPEQALAELNSSAGRFANSTVVVDYTFWILIRLGLLRDARKEYERLARQAAEPGLFASLFEVTPLLYEGWARTQSWIGLLEGTETLWSRCNPNWTVNLGVLRSRLLLALRDYERFLEEVDRVTETLDIGRHRRCLLAVAVKLRERSSPHRIKPKIFGIGLSKTGTTSLAAALTALGFNTLDWANPLTRELFSDDDLDLFEAFTDAPVAASLEYLYNLFPTAKFIYTVRPVEAWERSITDHFRRVYGCADFAEAQRLISQPDTFHYGTRYANIYRSLYFNHASYSEAFRAYDRRVREFFREKPDARFLEFNVFAGHGWPELCAFTGRAAPSARFPWANKKRDRRDASAVESRI